MTFCGICQVMQMLPKLPWISFGFIYCFWVERFLWLLYQRFCLCFAKVWSLYQCRLFLGKSPVFFVFFVCFFASLINFFSIPVSFRCMINIFIKMSPAVNFLLRRRFVDTKSALEAPVVYATDRSKAVVLVLFLFCVALWWFCVESCLALCYRVFQSCLAFYSPRLGKRELIYLCICLFTLHSLISVHFLFLLVSGIGCGLCLWHSLGFSFNCFAAVFTWRV